MHGNAATLAEWYDEKPPVTPRVRGPERRFVQTEATITRIDAHGYTTNGDFDPKALYLDDDADEPEYRTQFTEYGGDLDHYSPGLVPDDPFLVVGQRDQRERDEYLYAIRDRVEYGTEKTKQALGDLTHVIGANYSAGANGSKEWLDEQLSQMRIDYAAIKLQARRYWWTTRRRLPKSFTSIHDDPQLKWLTRRAELMRIRFNVRRHLEALGKKDVSEYRLTLSNAPAWDKMLRDVARQRYASAGIDAGVRDYIHPDGLICTKPQRRAA